MNHTQVFSFSIGDKVRLIEIARPAIVEGLRVTLDGPGYFVSFWDAGSRNSEWVHREEIE